MTLHDFNVDMTFSKVLQDFLAQNASELSTEWSHLIRTQNLLEKCGMSPEYFLENIAKKVTHHFVMIVQGEATAGDCPVMSAIVERFENHELRVEDVYLICSGFKRTVSDRIMASGNAELVRSMHQFMGLLDYNLYYLLQHYSTRYESIAASNHMQERLELAQSLAKVGSFSYDALSGEMLWSDQVFRILSYDKGHDAPELSKFLACCNSDERRRLQEQFSSREGEGEYRLENGDSQVHFAIIRSTSIFDDSGQLQRVRGTIQDVTQLKENELEIQRVKNSLKEILDLIGEGSVVLMKWQNQPNWPVSYVSENVSHLLGYSAESFLREEVLYSDLIHPDDLGRVIEEVTEAGTKSLKNFEHQPYRLTTRLGKLIWIKDNTVVTYDETGAIRHYFGILMDITKEMEYELELRRLNRELLSREMQYRTLFESLPVGVVMHDDHGVIIASNPAASKILKLPKDMIENTSSSDLQWKMVREDGEVFPATEYPAMIALREGKRVRNVVMGLQHLKEEVWISVNAEPLFDPEGTVTRVITSFAEITEQINTSRRLDLLSKVFTHAQEGIVILDSRMQIIELNDAYLNMCECHGDALLNMSFRDTFLKELEDVSYERIKDALKTTGRWSGEIRHHRSNGDLMIRMLSMVAVEDIIGRVHYYLAVFSDITDRKQSEEAMIEAKACVDALNRTLHQEVEEAVSELRRKDELMIAQSRLAAMGEMIGMIAHQWRQPLTVIGITASNVTTYMDLGISDDEKVRAAMQNIENQIKHLSNTIDDFRNFFKPEKKRVMISLGMLLNRTLEIVAKSFENSNIKVEVDIENETEMLLFEREMMQVLLNLFNNAKDAFSESFVPTPRLIIQLRDDAQSAVIRICDNAGGIDEAIIKRIFEPYFTTKGEKNGTGLGLYMSKTIVEKHMHGHLYATNVDEGACFEIILPKEISQDDA